MSDRIALLIAEFFYSGRFPKMPGTAGSLASLLIWVPSVYFAWPLWVKLLLLLLLFVIGVWACDRAIVHYGVKDPKQAVIDEVVGQGIPFLIANARPLEYAAAFVLFRFFDIVKPWPIKYLERKFPNGFGVMIDDVAAGLYAMLCLYVLQILI